MIEFQPIKTRALQPPKDDLFKVMAEALPPLKNGNVLVITSKVLAIHQGRCVKTKKGLTKDRLALKEADYIVANDPKPFGFRLTIKDGTIIASAGIDESNGNDYYILWPQNIQKSAREIWQYLKKKHGLKNLGVIVTDSHVTPLRRGVTGVAIGFWGFKPTKNYVGQPDIFSRPLQHTQANIADSLAAIAVLLMGEAREQTPLCLIRGTEFLEFTDQDCSTDLFIPPEEDIYQPVLKGFRENRK